MKGKGGQKPLFLSSVGKIKKRVKVNSSQIQQSVADLKPADNVENPFWLVVVLIMAWTKKLIIFRIH